MVKNLNKLIIISLGAGLLMTIAMYLFSNASSPISAENVALKKWWKVESRTSEADSSVPKDLLLINTSYDRELVPINDEYGFPLGNIDITDRGKLVRLLKLLRKDDDYKYILLDLRFEKGMRTEHDSVLWSLISSMPRLVIPYHSQMETESEEIQDKLAYADYKTSLKEGDFTKYILFSDGKPSMALRAYQEITGEDYAPLSKFYFSDGKLMKRCMMLSLAINPCSEYDDHGYRNIYHLGENILKDTVTSKPLFKDRIIVIGDFTGLSDQHSTYKGQMSGATIHANALYDLFNRLHLISWWTILSIWLAFSCIFFCILVGPAINKIWKSKIKRPKLISPEWWKICKVIFEILWSFISFTTILTVMFFILFYITGQIYEIIFLGVIFILTSFITKLAYK